MTEQLKPCPFCGGINVIHSGYRMYCHACGAEGPDADSADESAAIAAWNRRDQPAQAGAEPVAWMDPETKVLYDHDTSEVDKFHGFAPTVPLCICPPARVPLTDEQMDAVIEAAHHSLRQYKYSVRGQQITQFDGIEAHVIRETEAAHGIGGGK